MSTNSGNNTPTSSVTIKTSKEWVLPPRPKPGRKPSEMPKDKKKKILPRPKCCSGSNAPGGPVMSSESIDLTRNIGSINKENNQLKVNLLSLIHEYKHLKNLVLNEPSLPPHMSMECNNGVRKRSFSELTDSMSELVSDMNGLSYNTPIDNDSSSPEPNEFLNFISYDHLLDDDIEEEDEYIDSPSLSRTTSVLSRTTSPSSDFDNSLMTSLTRSTTVSTNNSHFERKNFKFYELPSYSTEEYAFKFDKTDSNDETQRSIIQEDKYNMVTDILEEKLISNDINYYEEQQRNM